jgi:hypothetical protein
MCRYLECAVIANVPFFQKFTVVVIVVVVVVVAAAAAKVSVSGCSGLVLIIIGEKEWQFLLVNSTLVCEV